MCLGTFSRLARSLATVYIFARVRIFGTSVPFYDLISAVFHTFSDLFPVILYIFRPAFSLSPLNHQHTIQRIFEIERDFKISLLPPTHSTGESSGTDALCREPGFLLARRRMRWRTGGTCLSVSELCRLFSALSILLQA